MSYSLDMMDKWTYGVLILQMLSFITGGEQIKL